MTATIWTCTPWTAQPSGLSTTSYLHLVIGDVGELDVVREQLSHAVFDFACLLTHSNTMTGACRHTVRGAKCSTHESVKKCVATETGK